MIFMKNNGIELLKHLYQINSKSGNEVELKHFVLDQLRSLTLTVEEDEIGNIFVTKGVAGKYPCVVAHLDEVHLPCVRNIIEEDGRIYALNENGENVGIGADDKNGVWVALQLLKSLDVLKVAMFVQEEKATYEGYQHGSDVCDLSFFDDVKYVLQCDRKGSGDLVTFCTKRELRLCDDDFIPQGILQKYGYAPVEGGVTDVVHLKERGLQLSCCNISCGYYNAHKPEEYTELAELMNCLEFVKTIVQTL